MDLADKLHPIVEWLTGIATLLLFVVAWIQLRAIRATSQADFIHKLNGDFFTPEARRILQLLEDGRAVFDEGGSTPRFVERREILFTIYDLDDQILGPLEHVGFFIKISAVSINAAYEIFGYYIASVWENPEVRRYVEWHRRQPHSWDVYERLEALYLQCHAYETEKQYFDSIWTSEVC